MGDSGQHATVDELESISHNNNFYFIIKILLVTPSVTPLRLVKHADGGRFEETMIQSVLG